MSDLEYPADLRYTAEHEWVRPTEEGTFLVGITAFAQEALGDVVYVSLPAIGATLEGGTPCGEVESTKSVSDLFAPVTGEVVRVNEALEGSPELLNGDPYGRGWIFEVRADDPGAVDRLLDVGAYAETLE